MMLDKDCHHDCNPSYCPFAQDTHNPNRYVCLKCGVEREINKYPSGIGSFLLLLLSLLVIFQLLVDFDKQNKPKNQQESIYYSPNKVNG
ncbi:MAG: hypothetical protein KME21_27145 [Desmonostoc vinosum HA7617-LM4]|nr:hypothetical protein [Desmonostoc vinosum HA7617-LM4]